MPKRSAPATIPASSPSTRLLASPSLRSHPLTSPSVTGSSAGRSPSKQPSSWPSQAPVLTRYSARPRPSIPDWSTPTTTPTDHSTQHHLHQRLDLSTGWARPEDSSSGQCSWMIRTHVPSGATRHFCPSSSSSGQTRQMMTGPSIRRSSACNRRRMLTVAPSSRPARAQSPAPPNPTTRSPSKGGRSRYPPP